MFSWREWFARVLAARRDVSDLELDLREDWNRVEVKCERGSKVGKRETYQCS